jgi:sugar (pentulose or hexulose) kinase
MEISEASRTDLMDQQSRRWSDSRLDTCGGPGLRNKPGPEPVAADKILDRISNYFVERWGFNECV